MKIRSHFVIAATLLAFCAGGAQALSTMSRTANASHMPLAGSAIMPAAARSQSLIAKPLASAATPGDRVASVLPNEKVVASLIHGALSTDSSPAQSRSAAGAMVGEGQGRGEVGSDVVGRESLSRVGLTRRAGVLTATLAASATMALPSVAHALTTGPSGDDVLAGALSAFMILIALCVGLIAALWHWGNGGRW